ncbi:uroporphyrinogen decarboxylase [Peptococcaceae bacterium CEB3]|nr:uroporphyrinogen decarboxylase [Peptococcaceae bacterium CEB3]
MQAKQIITRTLLRQPVDRVPIVNIFNLNYLVKKLNLHGSVINSYLENPLDTIISFQESLGHDPVINLYSFQEPDVVTWPSAIMKWQDTKTWNITEKLNANENGKQVSRTIATPAGTMRFDYRQEKYQKWAMNHPFKTGQSLEMLEYRPDPVKCDVTAITKMCQTVGNRAFVFVTVPGVFQEACSICGTQEMIMAIYDQPQWVNDFFTALTAYTLTTVSALVSSGVDCIQLNESSVGIGISPELYKEYIYPYDKQVIQQIVNPGLISSFHVCGKSNRLLELMADTGTTAIETLAVPEVAGDVDLAYAKKRVGKQVGLWGGFNERVLVSTNPDDVRKEVWRCLDSAGHDGGYVLRGCGQIYEANDSNWLVLEQAVKEWGESNLR